MEGEKYKSDKLRKSRNFIVSRSVEDPLRQVQQIPNLKGKIHPLDRLKSIFSEEELRVINDDLPYFVTNSNYLNALAKVKPEGLTKRMELEEERQENVLKKTNKFRESLANKNFKLRDVKIKLHALMNEGIDEKFVQKKKKEDLRKNNDEMQKLETILNKVNSEVYSEDTLKKKELREQMGKVKFRNLKSRKFAKTLSIDVFVPRKVETKEVLYMRNLQRNRKSQETVTKSKKKRLRGN